MVLTHVEREGVQIAAERIRAAIAAQRFQFDGIEMKLTASFGVACLSDGEALDFKRLVERADEALYTAKRQGRNRVEFAAPKVLQTV